jgi:hypothetical protein
MPLEMKQGPRGCPGLEMDCRSLPNTFDELIDIPTRISCCISRIFSKLSLAYRQKDQGYIQAFRPSDGGGIQGRKVRREEPVSDGQG